MTNIVRRLTVEEARALTAEIQQSQEHTYALLLRAHECEAWAALGYGSWRDYATNEFSMSKSRAYQLLDQARIVRAIEAASDSTNVELPNESQARALTRIPEPERVQTWQAAVEQTDGKPTAAAVREAYEGNVWIEPGAEEVVDAEIVDESTPAPDQPKRKTPLPEAFLAATLNLTKAAESLVRLTSDDRFTRNRDQTHNQMPELLGALENVARLMQALNLPAAEASEEARRWWATSLNKTSNALTGVANSITKDNSHV